MNKAALLALALAVVASTAGGAFADGMIVPIRPDVRVRGSWAVNYHHVTMTVRDQVASVSIDQEFVNTGGGMIEVEYLFPVPPDAAIDSMTLVVDGKEMTARLMKADEARRIYEDIVRRKKDPALLEYAGFGLYRTKAFPLEPNKPAKVIVHYNCVCKKDHDLVEVWYPLNTEKFSARPIRDVKVTADIKADSDISAVYSPTHDLSVERKDARHVVATYHATDVIPATDIQIFYRPSNDAVAATLLTYMPDKSKDGYFMMLASPNPRSSQSKAVPKDVVLVLDHSGSMSGEKIEQARAAAAFVLKNLNDADRFNVVVYNDIVEPFFDEMVPADKAHLDEAADRLDRVEAGSGTNIDEALTCAMKMVRSDGERPAYVIFMTDGLPTVGKTDEGAILADTKAANAAGARLFAFGVGYDVNVRLLDKLVGANSGKSDYVKPNESIETKIASLYAKIKNPVMTSLAVSLAGVKLRDMYPREIGDLFDGDQVVLVGRYEGGGKSTLVMKGVYEGKDRAFEYPVTVRDDADSRYAFVEKLWAMRRVGWLMDQVQLHGESKEVIDELVALSEKYGIITPYTSFLADESLKLSDRPAVMGRMETNARDLGGAYKGGRGQAAAMARQKLNFGMQAPARGPASAGVQMFGQSSMDKYEAGEAEMLTNVRQAGNQAVYRRGKVWIASNATRIDLDKDKDQVVDVERFSTEYFKLVEANTVEENQVFASQQEGEELVVSLRGQVYRIK